MLRCAYSLEECEDMMTEETRREAGLFVQHRTCVEKCMLAYHVRALCMIVWDVWDVWLPGLGEWTGVEGRPGRRRHCGLRARSLGHSDRWASSPLPPR